MTLPTENPKILLICFDNIGDLIFCSSLISPLKSKYPTAQIDLWCKDYTKEVAERFPYINQVFNSDTPWDKSPGRDKGSWMKFISTLLGIRKRSYDTIIVCSPHWTSAASSWFLKSKQRIGFSSKRGDYFLTTSCHPIDRSKKISNELCRLLTPLDIEASKPFVQINKKNHTKNDKPTAIIHPFAGNPSRCVPIALWLKLADKLTEAGWIVKLTGTPEEHKRIQKHLPVKPNILNTHQVFPDEATIFFGHDSGPTHIASALGIPIFAAYFDSAKPKENLPQGSSPSSIYRTDGKNFDDFLSLAFEFAKVHIES